MSLSEMPGKTIDRLTVALASAYALAVALLFGPSEPLDLLFSEVLFAGPVILASLLSGLQVHASARTILAKFSVGYWVLSAFIVYWTFGFEHDAQYQLMLFLIPMLGFPALAIAGVLATNVRDNSD